MPREVSPTHSAFLELREERQGMEEGYHFLDEKRLILAAAMLGELQRYEAAFAQFRSAHAEAIESLKAALARHGLEGLQTQPAAGSWRCALSIEGRSVLGVLVNEVACRAGEEEEPEPPPVGSPEAKICRERFAALSPRSRRPARWGGRSGRARPGSTDRARRPR